MLSGDDDEELIFTDSADEANTRRSTRPRPRKKAPPARGKRPAGRVPPARERRPQRARGDETGRIPALNAERKGTVKARRPPAPDVANRPYCLLSPVLAEPMLLSRTQRYVVGRGDDADIRVRTDRVSRRHAEIWWDGRCFVAADVGSTNGSTLNDLKLGPKPTPLLDRDRLGFGGYEVKVKVLKPGELPNLEGGGPTRKMRFPGRRPEA